MPSLLRNIADLAYLIGGSRKATKGRGRPAQGMDLKGSQDPVLPGGRQNRRAKIWDLPEMPLRPLLGDLSLAIECEEMITWSPEMSACLRILSQNVFQAEDGRIESWKIRTENSDGTPLERMPNANVIAIADSLANRYNGRDPVLGAQRLERAVFSSFGRGDAFMELAVEKDGNQYFISKSSYLPTWSMFAEETPTGELIGYRQQSRIDPAESDRTWMGIESARILQFSHQPQQRYGFPACFANIESGWRKIKEASIDLEEAARNSNSPWLHIMPPEKDNNYRQAYRQEFENLRAESLVTHMYLPHGSDLKRASEVNPTLKPLADYYLTLRYSCVLSTFPTFLLTGLGQEQGVAKELSNASMLGYARTIAHAKSILGEQIRNALALEYVLNYGYESWVKEMPHVKIDFPEFIPFVVPGLDNTKYDEQKPPDEKEQEAKMREQFLRVNGSALREVFS